MKLLRIGARGAGRPGRPYLGDSDYVRLEIDGPGPAEQCFAAAD